MTDRVDRYVSDNELVLSDAGIEHDCAASDINIPRADLIFYGLDHKRDSYEGRIFFNRPDAHEDTPPDLEHGYAGSYWIFGHDRCAGDPGHCDPTWGDAQDAIDLRRRHHAEPQTIAVEITDALHRVAACRGVVEALGQLHQGGVGAVVQVPAVDVSAAPQVT